MPWKDHLERLVLQTTIAVILPLFRRRTSVASKLAVHQCPTVVATNRAEAANLEILHVVAAKDRESQRGAMMAKKTHPFLIS